MDNILVPTDFSNNAYNALFHATRLVAGEKCTFHILNVFNEFTPLLSNSTGKGLSHQLSDESLEGLQAISHRIRSDDSDPQHSFKSLSEKGNVTDVISRIIDKQQIDLVVMGNSGSSEIEAIFLGSNTLRAISHIKQCPILTIPKQIDFVSPKAIAFVTDYNRSFDAAVLKPLLFMAKQYKSQIFVLHINEEEVLSGHQEMNKSILKEYLLPFQYSMHWMPLFKSKASTIHTFLDELDIDMLAMVNYGHDLFGGLTREPVIKRMAFDLDIPFLVIPFTD